jgi:hypothetical protein
MGAGDNVLVAFGLEPAHKSRSGQTPVPGNKYFGCFFHSSPKILATVPKKEGKKVRREEGKILKRSLTSQIFIF